VRECAWAQHSLGAFFMQSCQETDQLLETTWDSHTGPSIRKKHQVTVDNYKMPLLGQHNDQSSLESW